MTGDLYEEIKVYLGNAGLSTYCINAFLTLINSGNFTAKEISKHAEVPIGRIYESLDELESKKMVKVHEGRPKKYTAVQLSKALFNLISYQRDESKNRERSLIEQLKELEVKYQDLSGKRENGIFYSTVLGTKEIYSLYLKYFREVQEEILITEFINDTTLKVINQAGTFFEELSKTVDYGINVKMLWCFEDKQTESIDKKEYYDLFSRLKEKHKEFGLTDEKKCFEIKTLLRRIPTYFDIFDKKRVILKLQNPTQPRRIFASLNILDPDLAYQLRTHFNNIWIYEAID
ncbi:MAG: TrmB family transcriptional regulator [Candidatus Hodarchaeales archaeon]|jgi:sugar-specific transcriptional regulator TrmB